MFALIMVIDIITAWTFFLSIKPSPPVSALRPSSLPQLESPVSTVTMQLIQPFYGFLLLQKRKRRNQVNLWKDQQGNLQGSIIKGILAL